MPRKWLDEKAEREGIQPAAETANGRERKSIGPTDMPAVLNLRLLAQRIRSGDKAAAEELRHVVADQRAQAAITPAKRPDELDPEWQDGLLAVVEQLRAGVPVGWTEEELRARILQVVDEVRAVSAGRD
jgi:hypothetical protein